MRAIIGSEVSKYPNLFEEVFQLRHSVFVDEMGWEDIRSDDGLERDQFDNDNAVHFVYEVDGKVAGYIRALPTTGPHLLSDVLHDLCEDETHPQGPHTWEMSRYCVHRDHRRGRRSLGAVGSGILAGIVEWSLANKHSKLVFEFEPNWILRALQLQFLVRPLGRIQTIGSQQVIAAELTITSSTLDTIRASRDDFAPVLQAA